MQIKEIEYLQIFLYIVPLYIYMPIL